MNERRGEAQAPGGLTEVSDSQEGVVTSGRGGTHGEIAVPSGAHGGDVEAVARWLGVPVSSVLDLSASLNPFAGDLRPVVARHLEAGVLGRYPDEAIARRALAGALGVEPTQVLLTNGGAEAIALVASVLRRGWVVEPEFSLYRRHLETLDPEAGRWRSNPNNPLGLLAGAQDTAAVWDEAFYALATGSWTRGDADHGAVVIGSLTKVFACPGLRIGYVVSTDEQLLRALGERRPRWSLNALAVGCLPDLLDRADLARWQAALSDARRELADVLTSFGLSPRPSSANWVLVEAPAGLRAALVRERVLVRECSSFGMPAVLRVAVPDDRGLERLAGALGRAMERTDHAPRRQSRSQAPRRVVPDPAARSWAGLQGALVVCGTGSDAGKSALVTGLCRLLARHGVRVAPFKAQNMALNSWVTDDGAEIGRAQAVQAMAAGIPAERSMNPILLKPTGTHSSQVVVLGRPWAVHDAAGYRSVRRELAPIVERSLAELRARFDVVICEGAGSPAEINLLDGDFVNLGLARRAGMAAVLVGDIDRGGVFASLYGTVTLLPPALASLVGGFVINKFRGDAELLAPGTAELVARTGVPVIGVVPWLAGLDLDAEDSLGLAAIATGIPTGASPAPVERDTVVAATTGASTEEATGTPRAPGTEMATGAGRGTETVRPARTAPATGVVPVTGTPCPPVTGTGTGTGTGTPAGTLPPTGTGTETVPSTRAGTRRALDVAVLRLPHLSNATDIDAFGGDAEVSVRLVEHAAELGDPDVVVLPGTKATVADLGWLRRRGLAGTLGALRAPNGPLIVGICGGYQMLGRQIVDTVESGAGTVAGLGWLPVVTEFAWSKVTRRRRGVLAIPDQGGLRAVAQTGLPAVPADDRTPRAANMDAAATEGPGIAPMAPPGGVVVAGGYEIHHGRPAVTGDASGVEAWFALDDEHGLEPEGLVDRHHGVLGTSLHGVLEHDDVRLWLLRWAAARRQVTPPSSTVPFAKRREDRIDRLADALAVHLDLSRLFELIATAGHPGARSACSSSEVPDPPPGAAVAGGPGDLPPGAAAAAVPRGLVAEAATDPPSGAAAAADHSDLPGTEVP